MSMVYFTEGPSPHAPHKKKKRLLEKGHRESEELVSLKQFGLFLL